MTMTMTVAPPTDAPPIEAASARPTDSPVPPSSTMTMTDAPVLPTDAPAPPTNEPALSTKAPLALDGLGDTRTRPSDGTVMVYVPGGEFLMGSSDAEIEAQVELCSRPSEACYKKFYQGETPQHTVRLDSFWMDQTEVTNAQFVAFLNDYGDKAENSANLLVLNGNYCRIRLEDGQYVVSDESADYPVVMVT
jgi:formylglycine-generating enzyme required for sulfatase activity